MTPEQQADMQRTPLGRYCALVLGRRSMSPPAAPRAPVARRPRGPHLTPLVGRWFDGQSAPVRFRDVQAAFPDRTSASIVYALEALERAGVVLKEPSGRYRSLRA